MKKAIIAFLAMAGILLPAMAQETVTGVVVDKKGNPIPGVWIEVPNSDGPTITDLDGTFKITCTNPGRQKLTASYAGMNQRKVKVKDGMRIKMSENSWRTAPTEWNTFVEAIVAVPTCEWGEEGRHIDRPAFGLMAGRVKKWGYYVKGVTNFVGTHNTLGDYYANRSGLIEKETYSYWSVTGGGLVRLGCPLHFYAGVGYSSYHFKIKSLSGNWYDVDERNQGTFTVDFGFMFRIKKFTISVGGNSSLFSKRWNSNEQRDMSDIYTAGNFGIGYSF